MSAAARGGHGRSPFSWRLHALAGLAAVAWAAKDDLTLVSRVSGANGAGADAASYFPSLSGDGRYVAFTSYANNLSGEDVDATYDVFVRDLQTNVLTLASRATGAAGAGGTDGSSDASISADGRYVAFSSVADNLSAEDDNLSTNIFVRDLQANTTTLVSRAIRGGRRRRQATPPTTAASRPTGAT